MDYVEVSQLADELHELACKIKGLMLQAEKERNESRARLLWRAAETVETAIWDLDDLRDLMFMEAKAETVGQ